MSKLEKIEALKKKEAEIKAKLSVLEKQAGAQKRKDDTRLKVLIGAAILADIEARLITDRENTNRFKVYVKAVVDRAIKSPRDRAFLETQGWLSKVNSVSDTADRHAPVATVSPQSTESVTTKNAYEVAAANLGNLFSKAQK